MKNNLETIYGQKFFRKRDSLLWRGNIFGPVLKKILEPKSLVDAGCAIGDFVKWFLEHDVQAWGIEGSKEAKPYIVAPADRIVFADLREPLTGLGAMATVPWDLCISIEVAEHIEPEFADAFVANLCSFAPRILITAAGAGDRGVGHFNLQPSAYWVEKFAKHGFERKRGVEQRITSECFQYRTNRWLCAILCHMIYLEKTACPTL